MTKKTGQADSTLSGFCFNGSTHSFSQVKYAISIKIAGAGKSYGSPWLGPEFSEAHTSIAAKFSRRVGHDVSAKTADNDCGDVLSCYVGTLVLS